MDGRSPERGSSRGQDGDLTPQPRKTRRELRAEREAAERARTGEQPQHPGTGPQQQFPSQTGEQQIRPRTGPVPRHHTGPTPQVPPGSVGAGGGDAHSGTGWTGAQGGTGGMPRSADQGGLGGLGDRVRTGPPGRRQPRPWDEPEPGDGSGSGPHQTGPQQTPRPWDDPAPAPRQQAPRPWDEPEPDAPRRPKRPGRGPLEERVPLNPTTPFVGVPVGRDDPQAGDGVGRGGADRRPSLAQAAMSTTGMPPREASRRDRPNRLHPGPEDEDYDADEYDDEADDEPDPHQPVDRRRRRRTGLWLTFVALLLALWSATMFVDSASPLLTVPSGLLPLVTIFALPVIAIGVGGKHFVSTGIATVAALLPWAMVAGYASSREAPAGNISSVRVMTVDGNKGSADAGSIAGAAADYSADVVIVTGLTTTLAHDLTVAGLDRDTPPVYVHADGDTTQGIGVWSRLTVSGMAEVEGFTEPTASGVLEAGEARVGLTITQMPGSTLLPGKGWRSDLDRLATQEVEGAETGSLLVGDLKLSPWQPAFRALEKAGWEDAADVAGKGLRPTWPSWSPLPVTPADHLMVDDGVGVSSAATVNIAGSSHRALVTSLDVPTG
ncbi:hypothetical protein KIH74_03580 [Kineosporia sp. J2-2]|uniref:Endonuclease/exonuclease/phosphatase domain-containing protein n=1 Tax=Kineosporia corallincola TaxID=2835133 RepID=A0ABS5TAA5_9ACTN|nr:endonuclease/exonuclease/phosphatase family protein [Kineosporia corallincola]MBT0767989.1 hypothetical protein [Kineosporia corallincola]